MVEERGQGLVEVALHVGEVSFGKNTPINYNHMASKWKENTGNWVLTFRSEKEQQAKIGRGQLIKKNVIET